MGMKRRTFIAKYMPLVLATALAVSGCSNPTNDDIEEQQTEEQKGDCDGTSVGRGQPEAEQ